MSKKYMDTIGQNKDIVGVFATTVAILLIPLVAMRFTDEVQWTLFDFVVMGVLISGTGLLMVLASRKIKSDNHRAVVIVALLVACLLIWAEGAVGVFGTPFAGS